MKKLLLCLTLIFPVSCTSVSCNPLGGKKWEYDVQFQNDGPQSLYAVKLVDGVARLSCGILEKNDFKVITDCHRPLSGKGMYLEFVDVEYDYSVTDGAPPQKIAIPPIAQDYNNKRVVIHILSKTMARVELIARP